MFRILVSTLCFTLVLISAEKKGNSTGFNGPDPFTFTCTNECRGNNRKDCGQIDNYYNSYVSASKKGNQKNQSEADNLIKSAHKLKKLCPDAFSQIETKDYSKLIGSWVDMRTNESTAMVIIFKPKSLYEEFLFYNKNEKLKSGKSPQSTVFTAFGTYNVSSDVLVIKITGNSADMKPYNKSFHFVKFGKNEMILLNTADGTRNTFKKVER